MLSIDGSADSQALSAQRSATDFVFRYHFLIDEHAAELRWVPGRIPFAVEGFSKRSEVAESFIDAIPYMREPAGIKFRRWFVCTVVTACFGFRGAKTVGGDDEELLFKRKFGELSWHRNTFFDFFPEMVCSFPSYQQPHIVQHGFFAQLMKRFRFSRLPLRKIEELLREAVDIALERRNSSD